MLYHPVTPLSINKMMNIESRGDLGAQNARETLRKLGVTASRVSQHV